MMNHCFPFSQSEFSSPRRDFSRTALFLKTAAERVDVSDFARLSLPFTAK
jgi:hypothetical protein